MKITEAQALRQEMQEKIREMILEFKDQTGLRIKSIYVTETKFSGGSSVDFKTETHVIVDTESL